MGRLTVFRSKARYVSRAAFHTERADTRDYVEEKECSSDADDRLETCVYSSRVKRVELTPPPSYGWRTD